jgi:hypothetical protein
MTTMPETKVTTQMFRVYIKATPRRSGTPTRVTFDIEEDDGGLTRLTVTHELENAPRTAAQISGQGRLHEGGGGWSWILSDLKTLLETGEALA